MFILHNCGYTQCQHHHLSCHLRLHLETEIAFSQGEPIEGFSSDLDTCKGAGCTASYHGQWSWDSAAYMLTHSAALDALGYPRHSHSAER